jgi:transcription-repair coupling factor (superfamily II helicase)
MKKNLDVLSLSATPIPRTLHMSLVGIRDMSVLEEAPIDRQPIQTFVFEYNEEMVREAIVRELSRDGQVYYVSNRVRNIADVAARIQELVPDAEVAYVHGQMEKRALEDIMVRFLNQEIDVLVATSIIEIGLDIPNVNTIIIQDADRMGLSQLYQLRGRVGRSSRTAYAFLLYKKDKMLKEDAEKRLSAIREFTELGSGFKIAMRDLEIRGAGNMLGREQHGHMAAVGYDLYCKMLNEAVRREKGQTVEEDFDTVVDIDLDAYIPAGYISDEMQRLDIYKRIAGVRNEDDSQDMVDELIDRFGEPPRSVMNLVQIALLRGVAKKAYISEMRQTKSELRIVLYKKAKLDVSKLPEMVERHKSYVTFTLAGKNGPEYDVLYKKDSRISKQEPLEILQKFAEELSQIAGMASPEKG